MPDVWATVSGLDPATQRLLADVLETRGVEVSMYDVARRILVATGVHDELAGISVFGSVAGGVLLNSSPRAAGGGRRVLVRRSVRG